MAKDNWREADDHDMGAATRHAEASRMARAGAFDGGKPPSGPKKEPDRLNGVPLIRESGISKK